MSNFEPYYGNVCLFCGNKAKEQVFSGSYETYLECKCDGISNYLEAWENFRTSKIVAENRLRQLKLQERKEKLERELRCVKEELGDA